MKASFLASLFLLIVFPSWAKTIDIASEIKKVSVYPQGATILRQANVNISKGAHTLRFYGISTSLNTNSIQMDAKGDYIIQSIAYKYEHLKPVRTNKASRKLRDSLQILTDERSLLAGNKYAYDQELNFIISNRTIGNQQNTSQSTELNDMAQVIRTRLLDLKKLLHLLALDDRKKLRRIHQIQAQINQLEGNSPKPQGIIEVQLYAEENIQGAFSINYMVRNAGWRPTYDLKFTDTDKPIQAKYNAVVHQSTGVEWKEVPLTLSASNPSNSINKPDLHPWSLYYQPTVSYDKRLRSNSYGALEEKFEDDAKAVTTNAFLNSKTSADFTQIMESAVALDFEVSIPYTIPSDGQERIINLKKVDVPASYNYYAVPKLDKEAYLVAHLTEWTSLQLLPGGANIFMGGTFMGTTYLNPSMTSDTLSIAFGKDKMVQIERKLTERSCKRSKIAGKQRHEYGYEIQVRNMHSTSITLVIEDQIPISTLEEIEVELKESSGAKLAKETGFLTWEIELEARATAKKTFGFEVKHPRNKTVVPLN